MATSPSRYEEFTSFQNLVCKCQIFFSFIHLVFAVFVNNFCVFFCCFFFPFFKPSCSLVQTFEYGDRCQYVRTSRECAEKKFYVNYISLLYCGFNPQSNTTQLLSVMVLLSLCFVMFIVLGVTAEKL